MDWYKENIEEGIRDVVKLLRDNGFNTTSSCAHEMTVEGDIIVDHDLKRIHDLLYNYCHLKKLTPNFEINICIKVEDGYMSKHYFYIEL